MAETIETTETITVNAVKLRLVLHIVSHDHCPWELGAGCPYWGENWSSVGKCGFTGDHSGRTFGEKRAVRVDCWEKTLTNDADNGER